MAENSVKNKKAAVRNGTPLNESDRKKSGIRGILKPPFFPDDEDKNQKAHILFVLQKGLLIALIIQAIAVAFIFRKKTGVIITLSFIAAFIVLSMFLAKKRHLKASSWLFISGIWLFFSVAYFLVGRVSSTIITLILATIVVAGILLGTRAAIIMSAVNGVYTLTVAILQSNNKILIQFFPEPPYSSWVVFIAALIIVITSLSLYLRNMKRSLDRARKSEQRLLRLANNLQGGMVYQLDYDPDEKSRKFLYVSGGSKILHEKSPEEILNNAQIIYNQIFDSDRGDFAKKEAVALKKMQHFHIEARFKTPSGKVRWHLLSSTPYQAENGHIIWDGLELDITDRKNAEHEIKDSLMEKEILLKELYHRTKNNMQFINSLLQMQSRYYKDKRLNEILAKTQDRIASMALIHQKLYESHDLSMINLKSYIIELINLLASGYNTASSGIKIKNDLEDVYTMIDAAIPCGLVLNELVSNAIRYAFPKGKSGEITVILRRKPNDDIELTVKDNGTGLPAGFDCTKDGNMGMQIMHMLAENQLEAKLDCSSENGVTYSLVFQDSAYKKRV